MKVKEDFKVLIVYPNLSLMLVVSYGIGLFTKIFKDQGYQVGLFDTTNYVSEENSSPQNRVKYLQARKFSDKDDLGTEIKTDLLGDFRKKVVEYQPDFMIFSVVEDAFRQALKLLETIEDLNIPHLLGGVFPTSAPELCMKFPLIQMIGLGEGEKTVVNVAEAIRLGKPLTNIPNTWIRTESVDLIKSPMGPLVDINEYIPDFSLFDDKRLNRPMGGRIFRTLPIETFRGCPYKCTFCNSPMQVSIAEKNLVGNFLRRSPIQQLRERIKRLIDLYQPELFYFIDDSFLARPEQEIYEFCDMYEEFKLPFWFNTRPENCTPTNLKRLKEVGNYRISFGLECGNEEFRKRVLKRYPPNEKVIRHFKIIEESGVNFSVNLMIGFPGETRELIMDTVELTRAINGYDTLTVSIFTPYHGTELREVAVRNGWLEADLITTHTTSNSILEMPAPYVSSKDIDGIMRVLPLYCYFPKSEWESLRRAEIDDDEGNRLLEHYSQLYKINFLKETQDDQKIYIEGSPGCRSNSKDSFWISPDRMTPHEVERLTL